MADDFNLLNSDKFLDPPEVEISEEAIKGLTAASATALTATALLAGAKRGVGSLLDTQGYGVNSPVPKYETKVGKFSQIWNNALQASGATTRRGAVKEIAKSVVTGNPLELAASESSIKEVEKLLNKKNMFIELTEIVTEGIGRLSNPERKISIKDKDCYLIINVH